MKTKSFLPSLLIHYFIGGLSPLLFLLFVFSIFYSPELFLRITDYSVYLGNYSAIAGVITFAALYWCSTKLSAILIREYLSGKKIIIFVSVIAFGLTIFIVQIVSFWVVSNSLPDYAKIEVGFLEPYVSAIQPTIILSAIFLIFSFLNLKPRNSLS